MHTVTELYLNLLSMKAEESSELAELNSDHSDIDPSLGTGCGGFVIAHQSSLVHQPAEGALDDPAASQYFEALGGIGAFDDFDGQFGTEALDPVGKVLAGVATIHPQDAQPSEPAQHPAQKQLGSVTFGGIGRGHRHAEHQPQSIHQQMAFAAFDPLAGVIADVSTVTGGFDALTVQDGGRGPAALVVGFPHEETQCIVEHGPLMVVNPLPEDVIHGFPMGKVGRADTARTAALDQIQDGINDETPILGRASAFGGFGQHRFKVSPLGVGEVGVVSGDFHRPTGAAANENRKTSQSNQAFCSLIWPSCFRNHPGSLFQTGVFSNLFSFDNGNGKNPTAGLAQDSQGDFFGTTYYGGAYGYGTIFKITKDGAFTLLSR